MYMHIYKKKYDFINLNILLHMRPFMSVPANYDTILFNILYKFKVINIKYYLKYLCIL